MLATAQVFTTGDVQNVRLPESFHLDADEVWISQDDATGEITLRPKQRSVRLAAFLAELKSMPPMTEDFIPPRNDPPSPDPFEDRVA